MKYLIAMMILTFSSIAMSGEYFNCENASTDHQCLACNIYHEARGESDIGKLAVALVTKNRVKSQRYPNDYCSVVYQHKQFSWTQDGKSDKVFEKDAWKDAENFAQIVLGESNIEIGSMPVTTLWYHKNTINPKWAAKFVKVFEIGDHVFYMVK